MICEKCGTEMNTLYQHELQNISEKHLKYIGLLGAIPFGFVVIWIFKRLWAKKDVPTYACPNCGNQYTIDPQIRRRETTQSNILHILAIASAVIFAIVLVCNISTNAQKTKVEFTKEMDFMPVKTHEINISVGQKEKISLYTDTPKIYSFISANKKIATVSKKGVVKGKKAGSTTIKVYRNKKKYIGSIDVTVKPKKKKKKGSKK